MHSHTSMSFEIGRPISTSLPPATCFYTIAGLSVVGWIAVALVAKAMHLCL
jgi:hypothetical protein